VVTDKIPVVKDFGKSDEQRLTEAVRAAADLSNGLCAVIYPSGEERIYSTEYSCPKDGYSFPEREPGDADISVLSEDHDKVDTLFNVKSFTHNSDTEEVRNSNPYNDHDIQITSSIIFKIDGKKYDCSLTKETLDHRVSLSYENYSIYLKAPEDVLLIKALLQRGPEVGKNDIQDIKNFLQIYKSLDRGYLTKRISDLDAEERVGDSI
jgi:hypothetical protein